MTKRKRTNPDFLNGVPELLVLRLLHSRPMYGYAIVEAIRSRSGGELTFGEGCIYPLLHKLEAQQLLQSSRETVNGRKRVIYRTTAAGLKKLEGSVASWKQVSEAVARVLEGDSDGELAAA